MFSNQVSDHNNSSTSKQKQTINKSHYFRNKISNQNKSPFQGRKIQNHNNIQSIKTNHLHIQHIQFLLNPKNQSFLQTNSFTQLLTKRSNKNININMINKNKQNFYSNNNNLHQNHHQIKSKSKLKTYKSQKQLISHKQHSSQQIQAQLEQIRRIKQLKQKDKYKTNYKLQKSLGKKSKSFIKFNKKYDFQVVEKQKLNSKQKQQRRKSYSPYHSKSKSHSNIHNIDRKNNHKSNTVLNYVTKSNRDSSNQVLNIGKKNQKHFYSHNRQSSQEVKNRQKQKQKQKKHFQKQLLNKNHKRKNSNPSTNRMKNSSSKKLLTGTSKGKSFTDKPTSHLSSKTEPLAKQFEMMYRNFQLDKNKNKNKRQNKKSFKKSKNSSRQQTKKIIISENMFKTKKIPHLISQSEQIQFSGYCQQIQNYPHNQLLKTKYCKKQNNFNQNEKERQGASNSKSKTKNKNNSKNYNKSNSKSRERLSLNQKTKRKNIQKNIKTEYLQSANNDVTLRQKVFHNFNNNYNNQFQNYLRYQNFNNRKYQNNGNKQNNVIHQNHHSSYQQQQRYSLEEYNKRNKAAETIQKVYKGYIIRKRLAQYKIIVESAIIIQKNIRGFLVRKDKKFKKKLNMKNFNSLNILKNKKNLQITTNFQPSKNVKQQDSFPLKQQQQVFKTSRRILQQQSPYQIHQILQKSLTKANSEDIEKWTDILQQILYQQEVDQNIKLKILHFLNKHKNKNSPKSSSKQSQKSISDKVVQAQIQSQKRFIQQNKKINIFKLRSPKSQLSQNSPKSLNQQSFTIHQPIYLMDNLIILQKVHKQKLINNAYKEKQNLQTLFQKKYFSPRTHENKKKQIQEKLKKQIQKFQAGMQEVLKSCQTNQQTLNKFIKTPSRKSQQFGHSSPRSQLFSPAIKLAYTPSQEDRVRILSLKQGEQKQVQDQLAESKDLSQSQLILKQQPSQKYQKIEYHNQFQQQISSHFSSKTNQLQIIEPFDSSFQFIQSYLLNLIQFLRNTATNNEFRQQFLSKMKQSKNLKVDMILKNLPLVTEQSEQDVTFKLPLYKYLQNEDIQLINQQRVQQFNNCYKSLHRHQLSGGSKSLGSNMQQIYLKMIIDCFNQALNEQRPSKYIFTQEALISKKKPKLSDLNIDLSIGDNLMNEQSLSSFYYATAMNKVYKWASCLCGSFNLQYGLDNNGNNNLNQQQIQLLNLINQARQRDMINNQGSKKWIFFDQLIQIIVGLGDQIFDQIVLQEGAKLLL